MFSEDTYMEQVYIKSWGNSSAIRLPKSVLNELGLTNSDALDLEIDGDKIILKKAFKHKSLKERMEEYDGQITVYNFDWGEPTGREMF